MFKVCKLMHIIPVSGWSETNIDVSSSVGLIYPGIDDYCGCKCYIKRERTKL